MLLFVGGNLAMSQISHCISCLWMHAAGEHQLHAKGWLFPCFSLIDGSLAIQLGQALAALELTKSLGAWASADALVYGRQHVKDQMDGCMTLQGLDSVEAQGAFCDHCGRPGPAGARAPCTRAGQASTPGHQGTSADESCAQHSKHQFESSCCSMFILCSPAQKRFSGFLFTGCGGSQGSAWYSITLLTLEMQCHSHLGQML